MRKLFLTLLLLLIFSLSSAFGWTLTLEECVQLVMERNSGLQSSHDASMTAAEDVKMAKAALFPTLKLKSFYTITDKSDRLIIDSNAFAPGIPPQKASLSLGEKDSYSVGLFLRQPLFTGGNLINAHQLAKHVSAAADYSYSRQQTLLVYQVKKTFNEALIASSRIYAAESAVNAAEEFLNVAVARQKEGYADSEEVLRSEANLAISQARLIKSRNRSLILLSKLRQLTGTGPDEEINVVGKPVKLSFFGGLGDLTQGALERREDILSANEKSAAARSDVLMARSGFFPQIFIEGIYLRRNETSIARPELWSLSVQAEWSLFEWGRTSSSVRKAVARNSQLVLEREELSRSARLEIEETWREVLDLQSQVIANEKLLKATEAGYIKKLNLFLEGAARLDEVMSEESATWEAYDTYCQSAASLTSAFAALETSASVNLDQWTISEELYRPDFESYTSRIKSHTLTMLKIRSEKTPSAHLIESGLPSNTTKHSIRYLQLGAYLSRKGAQDVLTAIAQRLNGKHTEILTEGRFFKPVVGPYIDNETARKAANDLGIKEYLIRSEHEPRSVSP